MKLEIEIYSALCCCKVFKINNIDANESEFGEKYDRSPETAEEYGCGDMQFTRVEPTSEILKRYNITKDEYHEICERLEEGLSFGDCGWCI
jgi:hypothetical protein